YTTQTQERLKKTLAGWLDLVVQHRQQKPLAPALAGQVVSLLTHADRRRHPRAPINPQEAMADIFLTQERAKLSLAVHELSEGGMLISWQGVMPHIGEIYPVTLRLRGFDKPIQGSGCLKYELARSKKTFVGMQCEWAVAHDLEKIASFV